jgi:hypothetical protein
MSERQTPGTVNDTQLPSDLTKSPVTVGAFRFYASLETLPVMEEKALAVSHPAFSGHSLEGRFGILVRVVVEMPSTLGAPSENAVVWSAFVTLMEAAGCDMVASYVRMLELIQELTGE